jgi:hypothetical protein
MKKSSGKFMIKASKAYNKKYEYEGEKPPREKEPMNKVYASASGTDMGTYSKRATRVMGRAQKAWNKAEDVRKSDVQKEFDVDYANRMYGKSQRLGKRAKRIQGTFEKKMANKYKNS